ncbi:polyprotein [Anopheles sinensis]|uniref:Polyprotein n=1 Tax=Anopheles sinensis TaxID=74873 RepID=A0A084WMS7_ANOSI|nr:polyprotein [Anopheles sinensis]
MGQRANGRQLCRRSSTASSAIRGNRAQPEFIDHGSGRSIFIATNTNGPTIRPITTTTTTLATM